LSFSGFGRVYISEAARIRDVVVDGPLLMIVRNLSFAVIERFFKISSQ
jgi:hypothetical protein